MIIDFIKLIGIIAFIYAGFDLAIYIDKKRGMKW